MRAPAVFSLVLGLLGVSIVLGACDDQSDDHDHSECSDADATRADAILDAAADGTAGEAVFAQTCGNASCHGANGNAGPAPDLGEHIPHYDAHALACMVLAGDGDMPSQAALSDQELADALAYIQATF